MFIVLAIGPKVCGFRAGEDDEFLRAIKIRGTTSLGGEVEPAVPCRKILRHVKYLYSMNVILVGKIRGYFLPHFPCFATRCIFWLLPDNSGGLIESD
jgi:hypothetical protein